MTALHSDKGKPAKRRTRLQKMMIDTLIINSNPKLNQKEFEKYLRKPMVDDAYASWEEMGISYSKEMEYLKVHLLIRNLIIVVLIVVCALSFSNWRLYFHDQRVEARRFLICAIKINNPTWTGKCFPIWLDLSSYGK